MDIKLASEEAFEKIARHLNKLDPTHKGYYNFIPSETWTPNVNLYETGTCYLVCVDLAGVDKQEIDLTVENFRLKLKGKRTVPLRSEEERKACSDRQLKVHLMEIDHGSFSREVDLPHDTNQEKIQASFVEGLLWIELPKK